jgi:hypothetical protein
MTNNSGSQRDAGSPRPSLPIAELTFTSVLIIVGALALYGAREWALGARLFPSIFGLVMIGLGAIHIATLVAPRGPSASAPPGKRTSGDGEKWVQATQRFAWILAFPLAGFLFGFILAVPVTTLVYTRFFARQSWLGAAGTAILMATFALFVSEVLGVRLPDGRLLG